MIYDLSERNILDNKKLTKKLLFKISDKDDS